MKNTVLTSSINPYRELPDSWRPNSQRYEERRMGVQGLEVHFSVLIPLTCLLAKSQRLFGKLAARADPKVDRAVLCLNFRLVGERDGESHSTIQLWARECLFDSEILHV